VDKSGAHFALDGERIGQGRERAIEWLRTNPEALERLVARLREPGAVGAPPIAAAG
jgi:recombination protein RecA